MGLLRLLFAISVLTAHAGPIFGSHLIGGKMAVQSFFMLSGFYMALILSKRYIGKKGSYKLFITSRLLRIYPTYVVVLVFSFLFAFIFFIQGNTSTLQMYSLYSYALNPLTFGYLLFSNIFILGMDFVMFLGFDVVNKTFYFTNNYLATSPLLYNFLFVPQAWTLSLELVFYLLVPFLVKRSTLFIIIVASFSLILRIYIYSLGLHSEPWTNRFLPTELLFFLAGILSYRLYTQIKIDKYFKIAPFYLIFLITVIIFYGFVPASPLRLLDGNQLIYYGLLFCGIPLIFHLTKKNSLDRNLGFLSYPFYLTHILVISLLQHLGLEGSSPFFVASAILVTLILSMMLVKFVEKPVDHYRHSKLGLKNI